MAGKYNGQNRGKRLFSCGECGNTQFESLMAINRAARIRCVRCGSARMEISGAGATRLAQQRDVAEAAKEAVDEHGSGSVVPASN